MNYRDFLLRHNGGRPVPESTVHRFLSINHDDPSNDLERVGEIWRPRFPESHLAIAQDSAGNWILLVLAGSERESVYFLEASQEPGAVEWSASTFHEWLEGFVTT